MNKDMFSEEEWEQMRKLSPTGGIYRNPVVPAPIVKTPTKSEKSVGLVRATALAKPHKCSPPGDVAHFLYFLIFCPIREGSFWRCRKCLQCWRYNYMFPSINDTDFKEWQKSNEQEWREFFGEE